MRTAKLMHDDFSEEMINDTMHKSLIISCLVLRNIINKSIFKSFVIKYAFSIKNRSVVLFVKFIHHHSIYSVAI